MKQMIAVLVLGACSCGVAQAKDHFYQKGRLASMQAVECGSQEKSGNSV
jgi:hypothetical protein